MELPVRSRVTGAVVEYFGSKATAGLCQAPMKYKPPVGRALQVTIQGQVRRCHFGQGPLMSAKTLSHPMSGSYHRPRENAVGLNRLRENGLCR